MCSQKASPKPTPHLLRFVDYHHPILRQIMEPISFPLSNQDKQLIEDMKYSIQAEQLKKADAPWENAAGMASNQWGIHKRIFLYCPEADTVNGLEVVINPSYEPIIDTEAADGTTNIFHLEDQAWESCFSVPLATGKVKRYHRIRATYQNEMGDTIVRELSGWEARVWQHENDHLNGLLYDDAKAGKCSDKHVFASMVEFEEFFKKL